jgi:hypothetical protein
MKCKIKCTFCNIFISQPCSINANGCCWCHNKRTPDNINKRYIDSYGDIDVRRLGLTYPKDIFYCPGCKKSPHTTATFDVLVKNHLHSYQSQKPRIGTNQILDDVQSYAKYLELNKRTISKTRLSYAFQHGEVSIISDLILMIGWLK